LEIVEKCRVPEFPTWGAIILSGKNISENLKKIEISTNLNFCITNKPKAYQCAQSILISMQ
jgi:hypothetical protein